MSTGPRITDSALKVDRFGALASSLCAVHCLLSALLPVLLGSLGLGVLFGGKAEWIMTGVAISFALATLALGWRHHRSKLVALLIGLGVVGLLGSRLIEMSTHHDDHGAHVVEEEHDEHAHHDKGHHDEGHHEEESSHAHHDEGHHDDPMHMLGTIIGVCAGLLLVGGHLVNLKHVRRCREQGCET